MSVICKVSKVSDLSNTTYWKQALVFRNVNTMPATIYNGEQRGKRTQWSWVFPFRKGYEVSFYHKGKKKNNQQTNQPTIWMVFFLQYSLQYLSCLFSLLTDWPTLNRLEMLESFLLNWSGKEYKEKYEEKMV